MYSTLSSSKCTVEHVQYTAVLLHPPFSYKHRSLSEQCVHGLSVQLYMYSTLSSSKCTAVHVQYTAALLHPPFSYKHRSLLEQCVHGLIVQLYMYSTQLFYFTLPSLTSTDLYQNNVYTD